MQTVLSRWEVTKGLIVNPPPPLRQAVILLDEALNGGGSGWDQTRAELLSLIGWKLTAEEWAVYFNMTPVAVRNKALRMGVTLKTN